MKIGNVEISGNIFLAPMAGVTDRPFREICKSHGCNMVYSEMISAKGILYDNDNTVELLSTSDSERPVVIQLFGADPKILAEAAKKIEHYPFDILDINMGCPAPKIVKNGEGSALMQNPKLVADIVKTVSSAISKPLTIKFRKGFTEDNINAVEIAKIAEENGAKAVTVHGRTRDQYYSGTVDLDIIAKVKEAVTIPVIGSGDVIDPLTAKNMFEVTKCDALMIGRGAQGNPWIFSEINHYFKTGEILKKVTGREKIETALKHATMLIGYKGEYIGIREMRKHTGWYIKGIKGASSVRVNINKAESYKELENILKGLL